MKLEKLDELECSLVERDHFVKLFSEYGFYPNVQHVLRYKTDVSTNTEEITYVNENDLEVVCIITIMKLVEENY